MKNTLPTDVNISWISRKKENRFSNLTAAA